MDIVHRRIRAGEPVTRMFGYAGVGKTTLAKELASGARYPLFAAYTGKAASVLRRKGCPASTIHSLIYTPFGDVGLEISKLRAEISRLEMQGIGEKDAVEDPELPRMRRQLAKLKKKAGSPGFTFAPETSPLADGCDLLVLDEVSMVDNKMAQDLLSFDIPILALGDPAQLPPVGGEGYFTRGGERAADALLTKVERHDGAVIDLATYIRENQGLPSSSDLVRRKIGSSAASEFDQVLVGTNKVRWSKNRKLRELAGLDGKELVAAGERIICLSNNRDLKVLNGQQFTVLEVRPAEDHDRVELRLICECDKDASEATFGFCGVCGWESRWVPVWENGFEGIVGEESLREMPFGIARRAMWATYSYAITVHKSQGSEWGKVLVVDESRVFRQNGWRWLYTAVTRAQNDVMVIR
jgi:hypothetical protein